MPWRILNLGGEGEVPSAINLNDLSAPLRPISRILAGGSLVQADMLQPFPFTSDSIDQVVAHRIPAFDTTQRRAIAREVLRVLKPGGAVMIDRSMPGWPLALRAVGFMKVRSDRAYTLGNKP